MEKNITLQDKFKVPSTQYRSLPFWAWNDDLEINEIKRQIVSMKKEGMGGFFMHSRDGLETEYMGTKWKECIKTAVETAKENGMTAWLYDEDRWPSGTAGGRVTKEGGDAFRCKGLTLEICGPENEDYKKDKNVLALYGAKVSGMVIENIYRIPIGEDVKLNHDEKRLVVRLEVSGKSEWFNGEAPPDNLNPEAVKYFIKLTHEKYKEIVGEHFGDTVPGIFTDEPSLADRHTSFPANRGWIPWTYGFEDFYKKRRGTDVFDTIAYIYFNGEKSVKARHDYWHTISELYSESYSKTIGQWCDKENIYYTGHFLQEDKMGLSARVNGSIMPHYQYQQVPGIDMLCEQTTEYMTVKQCTSVAHQFNKPVVLSETYGCTGWEYSFEGQKWVGDWQFALGVNRRAQHLALYSIRGCRKRDYPPCFNYNTSWWHKNHVVEDYFARLSATLTEGEPIRNILVLHPMSTVWSRLGTNPYGNPIRRNERDIPELNAYGDDFNDLIQYLCRMHLDCDLGDEMIMAKYGTVEGKKLRINFAVYDVIVISKTDTMLRTTFQLLKRYANQGGKIIIIEPTPYMIEGVSVAEIEALTHHSNCKIVQTKEEAVLELETMQIRTVNLVNTDGKEEQDLLYIIRKTQDGMLLFVVNNNREGTCEADVIIPYKGKVEEWDPLTGEIHPIITDHTEIGIRFRACWEKADSKLYFIKDGETSSVKNKEAIAQKILHYTFPEVCKVTPTTFNCITLDRCTYKMDGEEWSESMEVWKAQYRVREKLGMRQIHLNGLEQRYKWAYVGHINDGKQLMLDFEFYIKERPDEKEPIYLVIEGAGQFEITCNEAVVSNASQGWFLDRSFDKVLLPGLVIGKNTVKLSCGYKNRMELENCYVLGNFGVTPERKIVRMPSEIKIGSWTSQGYFHYIGSLIYQYTYEHNTAEDEKVYLEVQEFNGTCATVKINGYVIEVPWAAAGMVHITDCLQKGHNSVEIEILGSPRNMLGPFHLAKGKRMVTNDRCFCVTGDEYTESYQVQAYGLTLPPKIYVEK